MKPGVQGIVWALPGLFLSGFFVLISVGGLASGMPLIVAAEVLGIGAVLSVLWLPVVLYLAGTTLTLSADGIVLREMFGLRVKRLPLARIRRITGSDGQVPISRDVLEGDGPLDLSIPVAYYDVIDTDGRRWTRLKSWVWNRADCERLRSRLAEAVGRA